MNCTNASFGSVQAVVAEATPFGTASVRWGCNVALSFERPPIPVGSYRPLTIEFLKLSIPQIGISRYVLGLFVKGFINTYFSFKGNKVYILITIVGDQNGIYSHEQNF